MRVGLHLVLIDGSAPGTLGWTALLERGYVEAERDPGWFDAAFQEVDLAATF